jgi:hypothetical protein
LALLNLFDGVFTYFGVLHGLIIETNPFMKQLLLFHPESFLLLKILVSLFIALTGIMFNPLQHNRLWNLCLSAICAIYTVIFAIHLYWLFLLLR